MRPAVVKQISRMSPAAQEAARQVVADLEAGGIPVESVEVEQDGGDDGPTLVPLDVLAARDDAQAARLGYELSVGYREALRAAVKSLAEQRAENARVRERHVAALDDARSLRQELKRMKATPAPLAVLGNGSAVPLDALRLAFVLERKKVRLRCEDDKLVVGPASRVDEDERRLISEHRSALMAIARCRETRAG